MQLAILSSTRWDAAWLSKQHLAAALAADGHRVLYADPPVSVLSPLRQPERLPELLPGRRRPAPGVEVWTPKVLPLQNREPVQRWNARRIERGMRRGGFQPAATVAFGLEARTALRRLPGVRIYHCTDSWADHPAADADLARRWEDQMVAGADEVLACSRPLVELLAERGVRAHYLPHGVDAEAFASAPADRRVRALPAPVVGYAGGINFRLDPELLQASLEAVGGGSLVLIGGTWRSARGDADPRIDRLLADPRVHATGHLAGADLAAAIAALDVGLVPYRTTPFNRRSFPLKVMQYLAAGVAVVSTPNGATDEHPEAVVVADDPGGFGEAVRRVVREDHDAARRARRHLARRRPWAAVARELLALTGLDAGGGHG